MIKHVPIINLSPWLCHLYKGIYIEDKGIYGGLAILSAIGLSCHLFEVAIVLVPLGSFIVNGYTFRGRTLPVLFLPPFSKVVNS